MIAENIDINSKNQRARKYANRILKLKNYGWETIPITIKKYQQNKTYVQNEIKKEYKNNSIKSEMIDSLIKKLNFSGLFPDLYFYHIPSMIMKSKKIINNQNINAIHTSCFPFTFHVVGLILKEKYDIPWIAEFRDCWANHPKFNKNKKILHEYLEKKTVEKADKIIINYGIQMELDYFYKKYPNVSKKKFEEVYPPWDGFDFLRYKNVKEKKFENEFNIIHAGNFYGTNNLIDFLEGLKLFIEKNKINQNQFSVNFFGKKRKEYFETVKTYNLEKYVSFFDRISYDELLSYFKSSNAALFIPRKFPGDELNIPGKIIDYIGAKLPIIGIVKDSWRSAQFLRNNNLGFISDPYNPEEICFNLEKIFYFDNKVEKLLANDNVYSGISTEIFVKKFSEYLNEISN